MAHAKQASDGEGEGLAGSSFKGSSSSFCRTSFESTSSGSGGSPSPYFSTRCQSLAQRRGESSLNELEFGIEVSKEHWSELSSVVEPQRRAGAGAGGFLGRVLLGRKVEQKKKLHSAESLEQIREVFDRLKNGRYSFFQDFDDLVLRRKIAEGGQAEIFEAECTLPTCGGPPAKVPCVVKVMKEGFSLQSLESQWTTKLCRRLSRGSGERELVMTETTVYGAGTSSIMGGTLLKDGRFAFILEKYCTDLRKLIDLRMEETNNQGPPFEDRVALRIMGQIARGMYTLHESHILHRDLKAANVLVAQFSSGNYMEYPDCYVADFECSIGVAGTGFWRAPEVLQALKNRNGAVSDACSSKADVYSFGMTCYEVLTGCFPFEGQSMTNYDLVLSGHRPALPDYVDANVKALLHRCWNPDPSKRPSFKKILKVLARLVESSQLPFYGWRSSQTWYLERLSDSPPPPQQLQCLDEPASPPSMSR